MKHVPLQPQIQYRCVKVQILKPSNIYVRTFTYYNQAKEENTVIEKNQEVLSKIHPKCLFQEKKKSSKNLQEISVIR